MFSSFGECTSDTGKRVNFKVLECLDRQHLVVGHGHLVGIYDSVYAVVRRVVFIGFVDLDGWVLGVDLSFNEALQCFWDPDIKTDLPIDRRDLETEVFLYAMVHAEFLVVSQDSVKAGEQLLGRELRFIVGSRYLEREQDTFGNDLLVNFLVISPRQIKQYESRLESIRTTVK